MSLDTNKPEDQVFVSQLAAYIRENRVAINAVEAGFGITELNVPPATISLTVGTELLVVSYEVIVVTGGAAVLETILSGTDGQVKVFVLQNSVVDFLDGVKANGELYLDQVALSTFLPEIDDVLALVNIGGNGALIHGYWKELYRTVFTVK